MSMITSGNISSSSWNISFHGAEVELELNLGQDDDDENTFQDLEPYPVLRTLIELDGPARAKAIRRCAQTLHDFQSANTSELHTALDLEEIRRTYEAALYKRGTQSRECPRPEVVTADCSGKIGPEASGFFHTSRIIKRHMPHSHKYVDAAKSMKQKFNRSIFADINFLLLLVAVAVFAWGCMEILTVVFPAHH